MLLPDAYYDELAAAYTRRRDRLVGILRDAGFEVMTPQGAYYVMCGVSDRGYPTDVDFCRHLIEDVGVAAVPGSSFYSDPASGRDLIRFTFCKREETMALAEQRMRALRPAARPMPSPGR